MLTLLTNKYFIGAVSAIAIVVGILAWGEKKYDDGYSAANLKSQAEMLEFKNRIALETTETIKRTQASAQKAREFQDAKIQELEIENNILEETLKANRDEANKELNRDRIGLDPSSVLRLDKIK